MFTDQTPLARAVFYADAAERELAIVRLCDLDEAEILAERGCVHLVRAIAWAPMAPRPVDINHTAGRLVALLDRVRELREPG